MIETFKNKALQKLFETGDAGGKISKDIERKARVRMEAIDSAESIEDIKLPGYYLHELQGDRKGTWSVRISANMRMTFRFEKGNAYDLDLEDYH